MTVFRCTNKKNHVQIEIVSYVHKNLKGTPSLSQFVAYILKGAMSHTKSIYMSLFEVLTDKLLLTAVSRSN